MTTNPGRQQNWHPISKLGWFTGHIREGITVTRRQLELLQPARSQPYLLDDATVARIIGVHHDQAGDLDLFQNQADRWKASPDLTEAQRAEIAGYEALIAQLRQVNGECWPSPPSWPAAPSRRCSPSPTSSWASRH